ncbi:hypothetical protein CLIB1423_03S02762 [[Candida] railenensis]|uniref:Zn(2)-C6 fungal-type domain-containing protein n=1 Tax=[Candida] railenensis TaxID=45579 RepID=A0A9P0QM88_9ASCO|nr:hypothetical protein CLIB1423_03S02762 [[Candida] railenensis]
MYTQSLLSYSISYPSKSSVPSAPIVLPPLHSSFAPKARRDVLHPPTSLCNSYGVISTQQSLVGSLLPSPFESKHQHNHHELTEKNLVSNNYCTGIPSPPKSVSSVGSVSPVVSPSISKSYPSQLDLQETSPYSPSVQQAVSPQKKRRQRSGPSCDSCRQRKVKCNAEINILSTDDSEFEHHYTQFNLSASETSSLLAGSPVTLSESNQLIIQNQKLVKFKSCRSCENKQLPCCFSKGFTKEDIIYLSKKSDNNNSSFKISKSNSSSSSNNSTSGSSPSQPLASSFPAATASAIIKSIDSGKISTPSRKLSASKKSGSGKEDSPTRKSSCNLCRQRKVKCIFNEELGKCEGCNRKNRPCSFDC